MVGIEIIPKMPLKGLESSVYLYLIINDGKLKDNGDRNGGMSTIPLYNRQQSWLGCSVSSLLNSDSN